MKATLKRAGLFLRIITGLEEKRIKKETEKIEKHLFSLLKIPLSL